MQTLLNSIQDLCTSAIFNNPGKIKEACFGGRHYADPIFNPCTGAIFGMFAGAASDGLGLIFGSSHASDYYGSGSASSPTTPSSSYTQPSLSDLLPADYKPDSSMTLSDVVDSTKP